MVRFVPGLLAAAALLAAGRAQATYSIVGVDTATREVGGAGTSCLRGSDVYIIYGSVPGVGVVHAQASFNQDGRDRAVEMLEAESTPPDIMAELTSSSFDRNVDVRQYAVADVTGSVVGFTGAGTGDYAGDAQGALLGFGYSVQGNILTSEAVINQATAGFEASGCDLAERLLHALEAGAEGGEGDSRCTGDGIPSDSAFVQVDRPGEPRGSYLELHVPESGDENPLTELRVLFDEWRATHPCPAAGGNGGAGSAGAAGAGVGGGAAGGGAAGSGAAGGVNAGGASGATNGGAGGRAGAAAAGTGAGGQSDAGMTGFGAVAGTEARAAAGAGNEDAGCSCRVTPARDGEAYGAWLGLLALFFGGRRRWNRSALRC